MTAGASGAMTGNGVQRERRWYAIYVMPQSEKKVFDRLKEKNVEVYLPLRRSLRQWTDRKKWIEEPLIRGYVFVFIEMREQLRVLETYGVLQFVKFDKQPVAIPHDQIEAVKLFLESGMDCEVEDGLLPGEIVEISSGVLKGIRGELISVRGKKSFAVRLEHLGKTLIASVPMSEVKRSAEA